MIDQQAVTVDGSGLQAAEEVDPLDVAQWQQVPCSQRRGRISRLVMIGYDAHPTPFDDMLSSLGVWAHMPLKYEPQLAHHVPPVSSTSLISTVMPLTVQQGYQLAAAGESVGCMYF